MLKGIHLTLMIGPAVPRAVSHEVVEALTSVEIQTGVGKPSTFQLQFQVGKRSRIDEAFMLAGLSPIPFVRVVLVATVQGQPTVLIDGVMTNHQFAPATKGLSTLTVTGEDLTRMMSFQDRSGLPFPAMPAFARVALILARYAPLGIIPMVIPNISMHVPLPNNRVPTQSGSDYEYITHLASECGYEFYLEPQSLPGTSTAYWGPSIKHGQPQPALTMDSDGHNNVEAINFSYESQERSLPILMIQESTTKIPIPIPIGDISPLNPPMGKVIPLPTRYSLGNAAKLSFAEALEQGLAIASKSSNQISARGSLDVLRYGRILQARKLVGVRGAGTAFDGTYYVKSVSYKLKRGEFKQDFELSRNALVSLSDRVAV
ncbi:MAG: hypothetical protein WCI02_02750 [Planctomycetota bacterium]